PRRDELDLGAQRDQRAGQVAAERGVTAVALRRHVADGAAALQAVAVRRAPPFALVVVDAARVEEQVSADRGDAAMRRTGYRAGGLRDRAVAADEQRMRGERRQAGSRADRHPRARALDGVEARDAAEVD